VCHFCPPGSGSGSRSSNNADPQLSVVARHRFDADPDPDPTLHVDADPNPDPDLLTFPHVGKSDFQYFYILYSNASFHCFIFLVKCLSVSTKSRKIPICPKPKHKHLTTVIRIRQNDPVPDPQHWSVVSIMLHYHCLRLPEPAGICKLQAAVGGAHC
jgi:hypothetical protein